MKTQLNAGQLAVKMNGTDLHLQVNRLMLSLMPQAVRNDFTIVNDVPAGLFIQATPDLSLTLNYLISSLVTSSKNGQLIVSVKMKGNAVHVQMESTCDERKETPSMSSMKGSNKSPNYFQMSGALPIAV
jgi:hypothetical protein